MGKVVFCGFGKLGKACLEKLVAEGHNIVYVMTHTDMSPESVDAFSKDKGLDYTYEDARKNLANIALSLTDKNPDYLLSVNYRYILPKEIFRIPAYAVNIHGSMLPKYRGRTPHVWSIINGETYCGITSHLIEETVDTGDIIYQLPLRIESNDTGYSLLQKYESLYPQFLVDTLKKLENHEALTIQDESKASYFGKRTPDMGYIDFFKNAQEVINFIRAQANPYPGAYYYLGNGKKIIINLASIDTASSDMPVGIIYERGSAYCVKCKDAVLVLTNYKLE